MNEVSAFDKFEQSVCLSPYGNEAHEVSIMKLAWNAALDAVLEIIPEYDALGVVYEYGEIQDLKQL